MKSSSQPRRLKYIKELVFWICVLVCVSGVSGYFFGLIIPLGWFDNVLGALVLCILFGGAASGFLVPLALVRLVIELVRYNFGTLDEMMDSSNRVEIISAYGAVMEIRPFTVSLESDLPYPKELIREALSKELVDPTYPEPELMGHIAWGFAELESFLPEEEYQKVVKLEQAIRDGEFDSMDKELALKTLEDSREMGRTLIARKLPRMEQAREMRKISADKVEAYRVTRARVDALIKEKFQGMGAEDAQEQNPNNDHQINS